MGALVLTSAPASEPVTTAEAKSHLRVDISDDNTLIDNLVKVARMRVEELTGRALITQSWRWTLDRFPAGGILYITKAPVLASPALVIKTIDEDGVETTFDSASYFVDTASEPARVILKDGYTWPDGLRDYSAVKVEFPAGYGPAGSDVPEHLKLAIKMLTLHYYENREVVSPLTLLPVPMGVMSLLAEARAWNYDGNAARVHADREGP